MTHSTIRTWQFGGITFERRDNPKGKSVSLPRHSHAEYQIIIAEHLTTEYQYCGSIHLAPPNSLVVLQPGEVHSTKAGEDAAPEVPLRTLLVPSDGFSEIMSEVNLKPAHLPVFPQPVLAKESLVAIFLSLHHASEGCLSTLAKETMLLSALTQLFVHHNAGHSQLRVLKNERAAVQRVRERLEGSYAENISLAELAELTSLSPFYLCRVFSNEVGLPPQEYQTQIRIERAKALLVQGQSIGEVALMTGFSDQSHLTRQFRKIVGVTPKHYVHCF